MTLRNQAANTMRVRVLCALPFAMAMVIFACNSNDARAPQLGNSATAVAAATAESSAQLDKVPTGPGLEPSTEANPPVVLNLKGPDSLPDHGDIELTAEINSTRGFQGATTIRLVLPKGMKLVSGNESESLQAILPGTTQHVYKISISARSEEPIHVIIDGKDAAGSTGFHAERTFPEKTKSSYQRPYGSGAVPRPPVGRPLAGEPSR